MSNAICIALDAMGGDHGPTVVVPAALDSLRTWPNLSLLLVGDESTIQSLLDKYQQHYPSDVFQRLTVQHTTQVVLMDDPPALALRTKKDSSMRVAINCVKDGRAQACVSAGNTGALMATARFVLKTLPGIDRPAILSLIPTRNENKPVRVLDLGANVDTTAEELFQFAIMGAVVAQAVDNNPNPKVALLNIGAEEIKGNEQVKQTAQLLMNTTGLNYIGYVEGDDIFKGEADVIVCDGFVGNVALKTSEGVAKLISFYIKQAFNRNWLTRLAAFVALPVLNSLRKKIDPSRHNGASLVGLGGIVIKSHGSANAYAFTQAIKEAIIEVKEAVPQKISSRLHMLLQQPSTSTQSETHTGNENV